MITGLLMGGKAGNNRANYLFILIFFHHLIHRKIQTRKKCFLPLMKDLFLLASSSFVFHSPDEGLFLLASPNFVLHSPDEGPFSSC